MKMKLYYVVKTATGPFDTHDVDYVAGPFTFTAAFHYKNGLDRPWEYDVAEQEIEVN